MSFKQFFNSIHHSHSTYFLVLPLIAASFSADAAEVSKLNPVNVTATRIAQHDNKVAAKVSVISAEDIKKTGAQNVPDALRHLSGVLIRDLSGNGIEQAIDIGGFGETANRHVAILINGRRINPIDMSNIIWATIPVENIERIEVLHGSNSVLYGDNAMGGVVNIITKEAGVEGTHLNAEVGSGNYSTEKSSVSVEHVKDKIGVRAGVSQHNTEGYRERSASERKSFFGDLRYEASDSTSFFAQADSNTADYEYPGPLNQMQKNANRRQSVNPNDEGNSQEYSLMVGMEHEFDNFNYISLELSHRNTDRESNMASWFSYFDFNVATNAFLPQLISEKPLLGYGNRFVVGLDFYDTDYNSNSGAVKGAPTSYYDFSKESLGIYFQDEFSLSESVLFNLGVRYEKPEYDLIVDVPLGKTVNAMDESEKALNFGVAYSFSSDSKLYGRLYSSFKYPSVDEFVSLWTGSFNSSLKQETAVGKEVGINWVNQGFSIDARAFIFDVEDEIAYNGATSQNENLEETRHEGLELGVRHITSNTVSLLGSIAYSDAKFTAGANAGKKIPLIPEITATAGVEVNPNSSLSIGVLFNYVGKRFQGGDNTNLSYSPLDNYRTIDINLNYAFNKQAELFVNVSNILNEKYESTAFYGGYYPMPETTLFSGVRLKL